MVSSPGTAGRGRVWWRRGVRIVAVGNALVLLAMLILAVVIVAYGAEDRAQPADVIIVLGGGTPGTTARALHGAALYAEGYAPYVLCNGANVSDGLSEVDRCAALLREQGVDPGAIVLEPRSRNTQENAVEARAIMAQRGWQSAVLVSDDYHLWRARWLFDRQGITVYPSPAQVTTGPMDWLEKAHAVLREIGATVVLFGASLVE